MFDAGEAVAPAELAKLAVALTKSMETSTSKHRALTRMRSGLAEKILLMMSGRASSPSSLGEQFIVKLSSKS